MPTAHFYEQYYAGRSFRDVARSHEGARTNDHVAYRAFAERAESVFAAVAPLVQHAQPVILEVGPAHGLNLEVFKRLPGGAKLFEDELDRRWEPMLRERGIVNWRQRPSGLCADVLVLSHVLEHFRDPVAALTDILTGVANDGLVYIEVPNVPGGKQPSYSYKLAHTMYFTPVTLRKVAEKVGLANLSLDESDVLRSMWRWRKGAGR